MCKKILAAMLALVLALAMGTAALAEGEPLSSDPASYEAVIKTYLLTGATDAALYPAETLNFISTPAQDNPDTTNLTVDPLAVTGNANQKLTINVPSFTKVGLYHFTIAETAGATQGVTYTGDTVAVSVLVAYNYDEGKLDATVGVTQINDGKKDTFTNAYGVGHLTVDKTVSGNLAKKDQPFTLHVTFASDKAVLSPITYGGNQTITPADWTQSDNGWTVARDIELAADGAVVTFANIPAGVTYTVAEDAKHAAADPNGSDGSKGYTVTYTGEQGAIAANATAQAVVNNHKSAVVDTGVSLDNLPYVLLLALAVVGLGVFVARKRLARER